MGAGLRKTLVPVFAGGGLDSKTDPRLVEGGALLELENMYMQRNGELRFRNGYTSLTKSQSNGGSMTGMLSFFQSQNRSLCAIASTSSGGPPSIRTFAQYDPVKPIWRLANDANPMPQANVEIKGVASSQFQNLTSPPIVDLTDPDSATAGGYLLSCWTEDSGIGRLMYELINESTGAVVISQRLVPMGGGTITGRRPRAVAGGSSYLCMCCSDNAGTPNLIISTINLSTMAITTTTIVVNGVNAAIPSPSLKSKPGSNNILIAYGASIGGMSCIEFNPATNAIVTGPVNIAAANGSMAHCWLDDSLATGSFHLATAGAAAGVVVRVLNAAFGVTATNVIDAAATANVGSITGYLRTGIADYDVLWDVFTTPLYNTILRRGRWTGAATLSNYMRSVGVVSSAFKASDGLYYLVASFNSATQSTFFLLNTTVLSTDPAPVGSACAILNQAASGANAHGNCPTSVTQSTSGKFVVALSKRQYVDLQGSHRAIVTARFDFTTKPIRPRELGNTLFVPGGIQSKYDGSSMSWSTFPLYPEPPTLTQSAGGVLTALGTYDYFAVYKRIDASGRIIRSAPSTASTITLTGANQTVTIQVPTLRMLPILNEVVTIEFYRRGPTNTGASTINRLGEVPNDPTVDITTGVVDNVTDLQAASGELLYTTGGVLENFPPPAHNLLEVNGGRVWIVNAEDQTEIWASKEYKKGVGIGFHQLLAIRVTGDGFGAITALAAMDGRLIAFKSSAIYVIQGDGPDDTGGNGSFNAPQAISLNVGTVLPGSVVATPDGIMFQSAKGIYILTRGFALTYLGKQVEKYTQAENVVDASLVDNAPQVRFVMASGRCLVWDYDLQRWYTFTLPVGGSTIVGCANITGGWCYATADGTIRQEVAGQYSDDGVAIAPRITFPYVNVGGLNGFQRVYAIDVLGEYVGNHTLKASLEYDYDGIAVDAGQRSIASGAYQYEIKPPRQKCSSMKLTLTCTLASGSGGFRLTAVSFLIGLKHGPGVPFTRRFS